MHLLKKEGKGREKFPRTSAALCLVHCAAFLVILFLFFFLLSYGCFDHVDRFIHKGLWEIICSPVSDSSEFCRFFWMHDRTRALHLHMSFTYYCIFCEVCKLWPCSSLQELVECKLGPFLYWWQRSQNKWNMAPHSLFGIRVFVQQSKIQLVS